MIHRFLTNKSSIVVAAILLLNALVCTQVPLLNYLGFEFSLLTAIIAGFLCGLLAVLHWKQLLPAGDDELWHFVRTVLTGSCAIVLVPLVVMSANAFFVKNCSYSQGIRLYILFVVPSVIFCVSLAIFASLVAKRYKKLLYVFLFVLILAHVPYVTFTRPQIFAFNPIVGYFPGFTYDEKLEAEMRLLVYRIGTLAASALLLTICAANLWARKRSRTEDDSKVKPLRYGAISVFCLVVCGGLYAISDEIGLSSSSSFIARELGGIQHTRHFRIVYPVKSMTPEKLGQIIVLHEYLFDNLRSEFQVNPERPITVFLYASAGQKGRLIGAARTDFTKPWLRQIHINLEDVESALKHEMVHAMLAEEGIPFLQVAPNSGLLEGAAVAAERHEYGEMLHRLAADIQAVGIKSDVGEMFTMSGFFKSYAGVSYVLAGSFCRFLIDRYGVARFKAFYRTGRCDKGYSKDLRTLVEEWRKAVGSVALSRRDLVKAAYLFKRRPLFGKECARIIANLNSQSVAFLNDRDYARALAVAELSDSLSRNAEAISLKSAALFRLGRYEETIGFVQAQLEDTSFSGLFLPLRLTLGDSYWAMNNYAKAAATYSDILTDSVGLGLDAAAALRLQVLSDTVSRSVLKPYFMSVMIDSSRIAYLESLKELPSVDNLARFLLGREYLTKGNDAAVIQELRVLPRMKPDILENLRSQRLGLACFNLGEIEQAKAYYWQALNFARGDADFDQIEDLLQRCFWIQRRVR